MPFKTNNMTITNSLLLGLLLATTSTAFGQWTIVPSPTTDNLAGLYSTGANNVWAAGNSARVIKWNGTDWSSMTDLGISQQRFCIWASSSNNVYTGGAGTGNALMQYNGSTWNNITLASGWGTGSVRSIWGTAANNVWITGGAANSAARVRRYNGTTWELKNTGLASTLSGIIIYGTDANNIWLVGSTGAAGTTGIAYKWNVATESWINVLGDGLNYPTFHGIYATDANNVWIAGGEGLLNTGRIYKWNGTTWTSQTLPANTPSLYAIHGLDNNNIWAVGYNGTILKYNGTSWTAQPSGTTLELKSVRATSPSSVWTVGYSASPSNNIILFHNPANPLPLTWFAVMAQQEGNGVKLSWTTGTERNTAIFEVQCHQGNNDWRTVGNIQAKGTSTTPQHYQFLHGGVLSKGSHYYRIQQTDIDGQTSYSKVMVVQIEQHANMIKLATENPVRHGQLVLTATFPEDVVIVDALGKQLLSFQLLAGKNTIDVAGWSKGIYLIRGITANIKIVIP